MVAHSQDREVEADHVLDQDPVQALVLHKKQEAGQDLALARHKRQEAVQDLAQVRHNRPEADLSRGLDHQQR